MSCVFDRPIYEQSQQLKPILKKPSKTSSYNKLRHFEKKKSTNKHVKFFDKVVIVEYY